MSQLYERTKQKAEIDSLTGIYNRNAWERLLELEENRCKRYGKPASIMIIDLNNLKIVNDTQGHCIGDRLIKDTATYLVKNVRKRDIVTRLGGDEFAILLVNITQKETALIAARIETILLKQNISAAVGWAQRSPQSNLNQTIQIADKKMYQQKTKSYLSPLPSPLFPFPFSLLPMLYFLIPKK